MNIKKLRKSYDFKSKTVVITGGTGVLGGEIAASLARYGANVAICDLNTNPSRELKEVIENPEYNISIFKSNVLDKTNMQNVLEQIITKYGQIDYLINAAGGNNSKATTGDDMSFFDIPSEAFNSVLGLNLLGTVIPCQIIGKYFAEQDNGIILNISSMNAFRPLTRIPAYSAAKAAVSNFTQWLAVHMAQEYSSNIRVNAIAPGFFLTQQNHFLLIDENTGDLTDRGKQIINHTPLGSFGKPEDLIGAIGWLLSPDSSFVTGIVLPIDGGFSAFSGV